VARAEGLFPYRQNALVGPLRLAVPTLGLIYDSQIVEGRAHVEVSRAERFFADDQRSLEKFLRLTVSALVSMRARVRWLSRDSTAVFREEAALCRPGVGIMSRVIAVIAYGFTLAACSTTMPSLDFMKSAPQAETLAIESEPPGAEAKTTLGQSCRARPASSRSSPAASSPSHLP
jgi:hypothetical protein